MAGVEVRAVQRHIRMSPQKVRLVLDVVRGKPAQEALSILKFLPQRACASAVSPTIRVMWHVRFRIRLTRPRARARQRFIVGPSSTTAAWTTRSSPDRP